MDAKTSSAERNLTRGPGAGSRRRNATQRFFGVVAAGPAGLPPIGTQ